MIGPGILFFPVTPFDDAGRVAPGPLAEHVASRLDHCGAVFAACGTGEFAALDPTEVGLVVRTAVEAAGGRTAVLGGTGGPLPHAIACARAVAAAGGSGLLLLPPYLTAASPAGLGAYVRAVLDATDLPVILYHRATARYTPALVAELAQDPRVVGLKDGVGDIALAQQLVLAAADRPDFLFFNGLLTAEMTQAAYRAIGVGHYSSAVYAAAPEVALAFHAALERDDAAARERLLREFFAPFVQLRDAVPGYAVALVKAGVGLGGLAVGGVRPPLVAPTPEHRDALAALLSRGHAVVADLAAAPRA